MMPAGPNGVECRPPAGSRRRVPRAAA